MGWFSAAIAISFVDWPDFNGRWPVRPGPRCPSRANPDRRNHSPRSPPNLLRGTADVWLAPIPPATSSEATAHASPEGHDDQDSPASVCAVRRPEAALRRVAARDADAPDSLPVSPAADREADSRHPGAD